MRQFRRFLEIPFNLSVRSLARCLAVAGVTLLSVSVQAQIATDVNVPVSVVSQGPLTVDVFFHEPVTGFDASDDVALTLTGSAAVAGITIGSTSQQDYTVELSGISGDGTLQLTVLAGRATSTTTTDTNLAQSSAVITVDNSGPVVTAGPLSRTFASTVDSSPITFDVTFTGASSVNFSAGNVVVSPTGTAAAQVGTTTTFGTALQLDAAPSRPHDADFDLDVAAGLTLEAWVKPIDDFPGVIVNYDEFSGYTMALSSGASADVMNLSCSLGFPTFATTNSPVKVGEWNHLACTVSGSEVRLYVNGVEQFYDAGFAGPLTYGTAGLTAGVIFFNPTPWAAPIDELRIWSVARSAADLASGMTAPLVGPQAGLVGYWQFDALEDLGVSPNAGSNDLRDVSGNLKHFDTQAGATLVPGNALYGATVSLSNFAGNGSLSLGLAAGIARDAAGNQSVAVSISPSISVTMTVTAPQILSITPNVGSPTNADAITFRVVFSEPVTGFAVDDLVVSKNGLSIVSTTIAPVDGSNYDVQVNGIGGINGVLIVGVRAGAVQNSALAFNTTQFNSAPLVIDNVGPTPTLSSVTTSPLDGSPRIVNINFDEAVTGFVVTDLAATNATLSGFNGSGASYSVTLTPVTFGEVTIGMDFGVALDLAGNLSNSGNTLTWSYLAPTPPTITDVDGPEFAAEPTFSIYIHFNENVVGFELADLSISTSGTASYSTVSLTRLSHGGVPILYYYRLEFGGCSGEGEIVIQIAAGSFTDTLGTPNELMTTITQKIDLVAPSVVRSSASPSSGAGIDQIVRFRIVADEIIRAFDASRITVITTGDVGYLARQSGIVVVESTQVSITFSHTGNGTLKIELQPGALIDRAGNVSTGTYATPAVTVDNTLPQLLSLKPSINERQLAPGTVYFEGVLSEPVSSLFPRGLTVDYAFLSVSNPSYPADLTSLVRFSSLEFITPERFRIAVDVSRVPYRADFNLWLVANLYLRDAVGNVQNIVGRRSDSPAIIDLLLTEATISTPRKVTNQSPIPINVQFTSAVFAGVPTNVTGFDLGDLNLTNATASNLTGSGANYSFDLTPTAEGEVSLWISPRAALDADNRPNGPTEIFYVQYDVTGPRILAVEALTTGNPNNDPSFLVYFRVSEPLDKPTLVSAVSRNLVNSGSLRSFVEDPKLDVPGVEVLRIGHFPGGEGVPALGTVDFSVPAGAVMDLAGNAATTAFALPEPVSVDRKPPSVTAAFTYVEGSNPIFITSDSISATEVTAEFTFDEPVVDFQKSDVLIERDGPLGYSDTSLVVVSPTVARLTVLNVASDGVLTISLKKGGVTDALGNGNVETGRFSVNINNIPTEVVSITPETAEFDDDKTSFVVNWSKPVSRLDESKFLMTGRSGFAAPVTRRSITFTPLDDDGRGNSLRVRVDLQGLEGGGEFALEVLEAAAVDRFDNPNLAGFTGPFVRRIAPIELGPFDILGAESDEFGDYVGRPDLTINGVFALRGTEEGPARLRWDGRFLSMRGRFEVLREPAMELFSSVGPLEISIDSETGEFSIPSARGLPLGGASNAFTPCRARLVFDVFDGRALRLSGSLFPVDGYIGEAFLDPRFPGSRIVLDGLSRYYPFSNCTPADFAFQVLASEPTSEGLAVDVRGEWVLNVHGADKPAVSLGHIEFRGGGAAPLLTGFNLQFNGFDWQAQGLRSPQVAAAALRFPRLVREQAGLQLTIDGLEIASDLTVVVPDTLVAALPCEDILEHYCQFDEVGGDWRQVLLTMHDPIFEEDEFGRGKISSEDSEPLRPGQPRTRAEILADPRIPIVLPDTHTLQLGSGVVLNVPEPPCTPRCFAAQIDGTAYRPQRMNIESDLGVFEYEEVAIFHPNLVGDDFEYLRTSEGVTKTSPASGGTLDIGGQPVIGLDLPFRINSLDCFEDDFYDVCHDDLELAITVKLPTDFQMQETATTTVPFFGVVPVRNIDKEWCGFGLPAGIPYTNFQLNPFCLTFTDPPPTWVGKTTTYWPINGGVPLIIQGEIGLVSGKWDLVRLKAFGFELPLGSGVFLIGIDASLHNMAQEETCVIIHNPFLDPPRKEFCSVEPIEFRGQLDFAAGPDLKLIRPFGASAKTKINKDRIYLNGTFWLINPATGLIFDAGTATLKFAGPEFHMECEAVSFPGIKGKGEVKAGNLWVNGGINVTIKVPKEVPVIGDETISEVGMGVNTNPNLRIKGWFKLFEIKFAVEVTEKPELVFPKNAASLRPWESSTIYQVDPDGRMKKSADEETPYYVVLGNFRQVAKRYNAGSAGKVVSTIDIDARRPTLVRLSWANDGAVPDFTIVGPDGTRFAPDNVETNPNVAAAVGYKYNAAARDATYVFSDPTPGVYALDVGNTDQLGEYAVEVLVQNEEPAFEFVNVATTGDELFLDWTATDGDDDAQISFFLDSDREGLNGTPIAGPFSEGSDTATVVDLAALSVAPGNYWVYARVDDGANAPQVVYADQAVFIVNPDAPPAVREIEVVASETTAFVRWGASADPEVTGYSVKWTEDIEGDFYEESISVERDLDFAVVPGLTPNTTYKFTVVAVKAGSSIAERRAMLRDVRDAAEGRAVSNPVGLAYLGDQIARLTASMQGRQLTPSTNLNAYRFGRLAPWSRPLEDDPRADAESLVVEFDIVETVALAGNNNVPEILSDPPSTVLSSGLYQYPVELRDRDGDPLTLSLIEGPEGMTLENEQLSWEPAGEEGVFAVTLEVSDGVATRTQSWDLTSAGLFADPLRIRNQDVGAVEPGVPFAFRIETLGGCSAPISYRLLMAPDGMTIDGEGLVEWTPPSTTGEDYEFVAAASQVCAGEVDEASRQYVVDVEAAGGDTAPLIPLPSTCEGGPTATLSGPSGLSREEEVDLRVDLTGTAPWTIYWSDGEVMRDVRTSPAFRTVQAAPRTIYSLVAVSDANCKGTVEGVAVVGAGPEDTRLRPARP